MQYPKIDDIIYFAFGSNLVTGSGDDGSAAAFNIRECGAAASDAPVLSGSPTLLTHADYPPGAYEIEIDVTVANGFAANKTYSVYCTLTVDDQNPTGFVGGFQTQPVQSILADGVEHGGPPGASTATWAFSQMIGVSQTVNTPAFSMTGNGDGPGMLNIGGSGGPGQRNLGGGNSSSFNNGLENYASGLTGSTYDSYGTGCINAGVGDGMGCFGSALDNTGNTFGINIEGTGTGSAIGCFMGGASPTGDAVFIDRGFSGTGHDIKLAGSGDILGNLTGTIDGLTAAGLATLFTIDSTKVFADAVDGSPVKEIVDGVPVRGGSVINGR